MEKQYLTSHEVLEYTITASTKKARRKLGLMLLSAILAGIFIGIGALSSNTASYAIENVSLSKLIMGAVFPVGLMMIVILGVDLFTSNCMLTTAIFEKKITFKEMFTNIIVVYLGNFLGASLFAYACAVSGLLNGGHGKLGAFHLNIAHHKLEANFGEAFILGILCNIVVCIAVLMMYSSKDIPGKLLAGFFPICAFVIAGFQHSIANMFYVPAAIFAKQSSIVLEATNLSSEALSHINWYNFFVHNLIPVTLGNFVGGGIIIAGSLYLLNRND